MPSRSISLTAASPIKGRRASPKVGRIGGQPKKRTVAKKPSKTAKAPPKAPPKALPKAPPKASRKITRAPAKPEKAKKPTGRRGSSMLFPHQDYGQE